MIYNKDSYMNVTENENVRLFLREDPKLSPSKYDVNYILNQIDACNYFYQWFCAPNEPFVDMLKRQHSLAALGISGHNQYFIQGWSESNDIGYNQWVIRNHYAGLTRRELQIRGVQHVSMDLLRLPEEYYDKLQNESYYEKIYHNQPVHNDIICNTIIEIARKKKYTHSFIFHNDGSFYINHIKDEAYDDLMLLLADKMYSLLKLKNQKNIELNKLLTELAIYYQLFLILMPFAHINNSIVWGQINVFLQYFGYNGVPHGWIDIPAMLLSSPNFFPIFSNHIKFNQ